MDISVKVDATVTVHVHPAAPEQTLTAVLNSLELLKNQGVEIMTAISEFAAKQTAFNAQIGASIDGIVGDVQSLNDKILELQNSAGSVTAADQALIDDLVAQGQALADRVAALDAQTPPAVPTGP